ncbi:uncharacterized protein KQ657_004356 [Scheffersomyces spartinae]|uniref:RING-type domain-containing protein n=1 Tax=Scheffersomyces spartinae TaxID=45513 RepID=A0A9P7VC94_9ASCO|nr:uncharacterized protein KQ657_004356 [Scheffersomyces spartinae]KAG7194679.1 hypothetical protein KQ657_004356 [Scheffersomyces spartinae]
MSSLIEIVTSLLPFAVPLSTNLRSPSQTTTTTTVATPVSKQPEASQTTVSGNSGGFNQGSFVGNTPLTVLFFLALAVGGVIASLFLFFTLRYFVRSRYGMHIYPLTYGLLFQGPSGRRGYQSSVIDYTDEELVFMSRLHFIHADLWERRLFERRRRRRRGGRFSRMAKLTEQQVENLFPKKAYKDWLNSGKDTLKNHLNGILHEEKEDLESPTVGTQTLDTPEGLATVASSSANNMKRRSAVIDESALTLEELDLGEINMIALSSKNETTNESGNDIEMLELHFSSGSCAICLELYDDDDEVRGLICGHVFHSDCLDPWLTKRRACCPMCKRDYFYNGDAEGTNEEAESHTRRGDRSTNNADNNEINSNRGANTAGNGGNNDTTTPTTTANNNNEEEDTPVFDIELVRNDPTLRSILQQLISTEERARMILADENIQRTDIEARANVVADKKYLPLYKRVWWKLMGIKHLDLFNWTVVRLYHEYRESNPIPDPIAAARNGTATNDANTATNDSNGSTTNDSNGTATDGANSTTNYGSRTSDNVTATNNTNQTESGTTTNAASGTTNYSTATSANNSTMNISPQHLEVDLSDASNTPGPN